MRNYSTMSAAAPRPVGWIPQVVTSLVGGLFIFNLFLVAAIIGWDTQHAGRIYPGISVAGVDLSGLEPAEAAVVIEERIDFPKRGRVLFRDGEKIWLTSPSEVGFFLDPQTTALSAYQLGRQGNPVARVVAQFDAWYTGMQLPPLYVFDESRAQAFLAGIASQNDVPTVDASLSVDGVDVVVRPGQVGRSLDIPGTLDLLKEQLQTLRDGEVPLVIEETPPVILDVDEQAELARRILSEPLVLNLPNHEEGDPGPWKFERDVLAQMLTIERVTSSEGDHYQVGLQAEQLRSFLDGLAPELLRYQQNARFIFNDDTRQLEVIEPAVTGRELDVGSTIRSINEKLLAGDHNISLDVMLHEPEVGDDATGEQLGITELVSSHTSYFYGSSSARAQNITTASSRFHGLLVPPGATFSMGSVLGDVSLDNGYAEALIIFGNRTIQGVGGGVCQVSTTLFRAVFFGGFPIVERYPHAYRVSYYELKADGGYDTRLAGLDATVFVPLVDFKFLNDTPHWLLMETYVNETARTLTWKFYSTGDGRSVEWGSGGLQNIEEPPDPVYEENPDLAKGEVKQVDWAVEGADVTITRTVSRDGQVLYEDTITTHYLPWQDVYQYGPGTKNMPPDEDDDKKNNDDD
jgi:vancomycin resistance protein YoaR